MIKNQDDHYQRKKQEFAEKEREIRNLVGKLKMHRPCGFTNVDITGLGMQNRLEITKAQAQKLREEIEELEEYLKSKPSAPRILLLRESLR